MKKLKLMMAGLLLVLVLAMVPKAYADETVVVTTEPPVTTTVPETAETTTESDEDRLNRIEEELQKISEGLSADDIDNSTPVKWLENYLGISLAGIGSFLLGILTALLFAIKLVKKAKSVINSSDTLSSKAKQLCESTSESVDELQIKVQALVDENKSVSDETKAKLTEISGAIDSFQEYVKNNNSAIIAIVDKMEGTLNDEEKI